MESENPSGADNQQGSPPDGILQSGVTPQRLHAELLAASAIGLEAYLQGALRDATFSARHGTHRFGQSNREWLQVIADSLAILGHRSWIYREGSSRIFWILETSAKFLSLQYDPVPLVGSPFGCFYVRGYFDADGGMPREPSDRLYFQICQRDKKSLEGVVALLDTEGILCGRIHNPSRGVDPEYWRFFVRTASHQMFMERVNSWH